MTLDERTRGDFVKEMLLGIFEWDALLCTLAQDTDEQLAYYAVKLRECIEWINAQADMANFFDLPETEAGARAKAEEMSAHRDEVEAFLEAGGYGT